VVPQADVLRAWAAERGIEGDAAAQCVDPTVIEHYREIVDSKMAAFSRYERVRKFTLVPDEFNQEAGELTPTLKLKRRVLLAKYADIIDSMYNATGDYPGF
jgi:long-chain acyl-CoA synthetase